MRPVALRRKAWPEPDATIMTDASKVAGEWQLYLGDDGKLYGM